MKITTTEIEMGLAAQEETNLMQDIMRGGGPTRDF
jgi:hypothetical protein